MKDGQRCAMLLALKTEEEGCMARNLGGPCKRERPLETQEGTHLDDTLILAK